MGKILYTKEDVSTSLPDELREHFSQFITRMINFNEQGDGDKKRKNAEEINFIFRLVADERMASVWQKLFKINSDKTIIFFPASVSLIYSEFKIFNSFDPILHKYHLAPRSFFDTKPTIERLEGMVLACKDLLKESKRHTFYTTEFDFEEYDRDQLIGESEHNEFVRGIKNYLTRLEQVLFYYKSNLDKSELESYLANPVSRKKSTDNAEALLWAKKLQVIILRFYGKPLNKELGTMISALFPDDKRCYDEDYIAKITKSVRIAHKKLEDSF